MRRLTYLCRWFDLLCMFGMREKVHSFWEVILEFVECFIENCRHLVQTFKKDSVEWRVAM